MPISITEARQRFSDAGFSRQDRYQAGTAGKGGAWVSSKGRAKENYAPAMAEVLSKKSFDKGLDKADAGSYDAGIRNKGVPNWQTGMSASGDKYVKGVQPFVPLWTASLPTAPGPRRSAANSKRMMENSLRFIATSGK